MLSTTTYNYDHANRLTDVNGVTYTWDANGNLLNDGVNTYVYDSANRLKSVSNQSSVSGFKYNGLGDRLSQTVNGNTPDKHHSYWRSSSDNRVKKLALENFLRGEFALSSHHCGWTGDNFGFSQARANRGEFANIHENHILLGRFFQHVVCVTRVKTIQ